MIKKSRIKKKVVRIREVWEEKEGRMGGWEKGGKNKNRV